MNTQTHLHPDVKNLFKREQARIPAWKRVIDITCCVLALPALGLITVVMAALQRFSTRGPVLFKQERVGYKGSHFICYKFRTMVVGAETKSHQAYLANLLTSTAPMVKLDSKGDKRLIPGGWLLRATGLDELPQIINVLKGEMSIVGPRPCLQYEYEKYEDWQRERFDAVPGLTGLWQVSGKNRTTFSEMIRLDIRYAQTSSFWLDVRIIAMTIPALVIQVMETRMSRKGQAEPARPARIHVQHATAKHKPQPVAP